MYVALSGGKRQIVDLLFLAAAKFAKARIFVHHHSFAYLDHPNPLARVCMRVAGPQATHLVLCGKMKRDLQQYYRSARNVQVISNAALPSVAGRWRMRPNLRTVGYLSALTQEKGIYTFLEIAERLAGKFPSLNFVIAGPCSDPSVLARVSATSREYPQITYAGPVYGDSKTAYLDSIDALLFPTTYKNEAEPLVIWEAISAGIPVLGWDRGCIGEMLTFLSSPSTAIEKSESFSDVALATLEHWLASPEMFRQASADMKTHFELSAKRSVAHLEEIFGLGQASRREEWAQA